MKFIQKTAKSLLLMGMLITVSACLGQQPAGKSGAKAKDQLGKRVTSLGRGVRVVFQDSQMNVWLGGSKQGLFRLSATELRLFTEEDGLSGHAMVGIQEDAAGNVYFDTWNGVSKFDGKQFKTLPMIEDASRPNEWKLESGDLWFRMGWDKSGPYRYDGEFLYYLEFPKTEQEEMFNSAVPNASFNPYGIYSLYRDSHGMMWFGTASLGVCRFDGTSVRWLYEDDMTNTPNGGSFGIRSIFEDQSGHFWFTNTRYRYDIAGPANQPADKTLAYQRKDGFGFPTESGGMDYPYFMSIAEDEKGQLWITGDDGVWRKNGTELVHYPVMDDEKAVSVFSIYIDKQDKPWLVTLGSGIYEFNGKTFEKFKL